MFNSQKARFLSFIEMILFPRFRHKKVSSPGEGSSPESTEALPQGLMRPESAASLLAAPYRQKLLEHIWQRTSVSRPRFDFLYLAPIKRYVEWVQRFPASESHHHAYPGGMLDHGLETVAYALKLRQSRLLPVGAPPEDQAAQSEAWNAALAYAALLHDIGKIAVDLHVEQADGSVWHPWHGPLARPYRFRYVEGREYRLHGAAAGLFHRVVLDAGILDWLSAWPTLWASFLYALAGRHEQAGPLGELVIQADQASVAQALGGDPAKAVAVPRHALQRKLLDGLRYLLRTEFKLNQSGPSDGWLTREALWLVSKTVSDKLRAHLLSLGIDGIPSSNTAVFNILQDHGIVLPTANGKAIWKATVTGGSGWSHTFTFLKCSPAVIWDAGERPEAFAGTVTVMADEDGAENNDLSVPPQTRQTQQTATERAPLESPPELACPVSSSVENGEDVFMEPPSAEISGQRRESQRIGLAGSTARMVSEAEQELLSVPAITEKSSSAVPAAGPAAPEETPSGEHFVVWLRQGILTRKLIINDAKALAHTVAGTVYLISPGVFQRYAREHLRAAALAKPETLEGWQWVQKRFEKLGLHRKQPNGLNIWTCEVTGPRKSKRVHGYLLKDPRCLFEELPVDNPYLSVIQDSDDR